MSVQTLSPATEAAPADGIPAAVMRVAETLLATGLPMPAILVVPPGGLLFVNPEGVPLIQIIGAPSGGAQMLFCSAAEDRPSVTIGSLYEAEGVTIADNEGAGPGRVTLGLEGGNGFLETRTHEGTVNFVVPLRARTIEG